MIPYMVGKLASNTTNFTGVSVKCVPRRGYFRAVPSQNGDKLALSPTQLLNNSVAASPSTDVATGGLPREVSAWSSVWCQPPEPIAPG